MLTRIETFYYETLRPYLENPWIVGPVVGIAVVLLVCVLVIRSRTRAMKIFKTQTGLVHVSRRALRELVQSACRHVNTANRPRVKFYARHSKLNLAVKIKLNEGQRLTDVSAQLQSRIAETLHETLSMEKVGRIDIIVTGIRRMKNAPAVIDEEPPAPIEDVAPVKQEEDHFISTEDEPVEHHADLSKDEELVLAKTSLLAETKDTKPSDEIKDEEIKEDEPAVAEEKKPKRGLLGFGRRHKEEKADGASDAIDDPLPEPESVEKPAEDEKKV